MLSSRVADPASGDRSDRYEELIESRKVIEMLRKVEIVSPGDTRLLRGEQLEYTTLLDENERAMAEGKQTGSVGVGIVPAQLTTKLTDHLACMKGTEKGGAPCIALRHTQEEGWRCSIYENRPTPCREFNILNEDGTPNPDCERLQQVARQKRLASN